MGTTLTGTTPQDTYDSLIKVTDNGPLSGTAKYLSDGLGNDSVLALSTARVGVGTASPAALLTLQDGNVDNVSGSKLRMVMGPNPYWEIQANNGGVAADRKLVFNTSASAGDVLTLNQSGNVGIGTSSPSSPLTVYKASSPDVDIQNSSALHRITGDAGSLLIRADYGNTAANTHIQFSLDGTEVGRFTPNGLTFNGDTAAANALDDYEEGTFNPTIIGSATAGTADYVRAARYTKIGRQVTVQIDISWTNGTGSGDLQISGLPFNESQSATNPAVSIGFISGISLNASHYALGYIANSTNRIDLVQYPVGGSTLASLAYSASGRLILNATYLA